MCFISFGFLHKIILLCILFVCATAKRNVYPLRNNGKFIHQVEKLKDVTPKLDDRDMIAVFPPLTNVQRDATLLEEDEYRWIARVFHARNSNSPYMCTASCIDYMIFVTAATCVASLKLEYTTVLYAGHWLNPKALVLPSNLSRQGFDDIGFIVCHRTGQVPYYYSVDLSNVPSRTDSNWFSKNYKSDDRNFKVIGFGAPSIDADNYITEKVYPLTTIEVVVNYKLCRDSLPPKETTIYDVPCYSSCVPSKYYTDNTGVYKSNDNSCNKFHQVVGSAVVEKKSGHLVGVSTWGAGLGKHPLPVGFSVINSENFNKDYRCAVRVRDTYRQSPGHFQTLCKD